MSLPKRTKHFISLIILAAGMTIGGCWNPPGITFEYVTQEVERGYYDQ